MFWIAEIQRWFWALWTPVSAGEESGTFEGDSSVRRTRSSRLSLALRVISGLNKGHNYIIWAPHSHRRLLLPGALSSLIWGVKQWNHCSCPRYLRWRGGVRVGRACRDRWGGWPLLTYTLFSVLVQKTLRSPAHCPPYSPLTRGSLPGHRRTTGRLLPSPWRDSGRCTITATTMTSRP